jgi:hypothetical protein
MKEGKLLGHIVSIEGVRIDFGRVKAIKKLLFLEIRRKCNPFWEKYFFSRDSSPILLKE